MTRGSPAGAAPPRVLVLRCPELLGDAAGDAGLLSDDGLAEEADSAAARAFEPAVAIAGEFCPQLEVLRPGALALPARGPARYFGGEEKLAAALRAAVRRSGVSCQAGIADGLFAAGLAARAGQDGVVVPPGTAREFLAGFDVGVLGLPGLCELLPRLGIETLGQLAELPAAEAASRFGPEGELAGRLARGLDPRPLIPRPPAADLSAAAEFDPPAAQSDRVVFAAKALAGELHERLAAAGLGCVRIRAEVRFADGSAVSRLWRHDGLLSALAVAERVRWQLDALAGQRGGGEQDGVAGLRLVPEQLARAAGRQLALWGDPVVSDRVARAAVRVQAMLGHDRVTRPVLAGGRRPAEQVVLVPFGDTRAPPRPPGRPWPGQLPAPSPATVYAAPRPAAVTDAAGAAVRVSGRLMISAPPAQLSVDGGPARAVTAWAGPWPVLQRWWDPQQACRQARFQLLTGDTGWLAVLQDGRWLIEARYD